jgi:hypothetical protein
MTLPIDPSQPPPPEPVSDAAPRTVAKTPPSQPVVRRLSFRRKWCFRLLAMSLPLAGLVLIELGLRWASVGMDLGLVESVGDGAPAQTFRFNPWTDQAYYGATDLSGPEPRPFMLPKPEGTFRIVVVGGSTVVGFPYPSDLAFPRFLEILLSQQGLNRKFEVLNAGITAINSFSEADLVEQAVACEPDLILVYTGHNEFVGPGGVGSKFGGVSPRWSAALFAARRTRLYQILLGGRGTPDNRPLDEQLPGDLKIPLGSGKFRAAEDCLRSNLNRMVDVAIRARTPLLLTTPITNLRHQYPMQSLSREGLTNRELSGFQDELGRGEELLAAEKYDAALRAFDRARAIDDGFALLAFRRGQCLESLERWDEALVEYQSACDLDACRFRAPSSFARIFEDCAAGARTATVHFLDTAAQFARATPHGIPGRESFLEHVHFTYAGNWHLAEILAEDITLQILKESWRADRVPAEAVRDDLCGVLPQDHLMAETMILMMFERPPLNQADDAALQQEQMRSRLHRRFFRLSPNEREVFGDLSTEMMQADVLGSLFARYAAAGMNAEEGDLLRRAAVRQPWRFELVFPLAQWEFQQGHIERAQTALGQALKWKPDAPAACQLRERLQQLRTARDR